MINVISINASPLADRGNTAKILNPFLKGLEESGAVIDKFNLSDLTINPCKGDIRCWTRNPGICWQKDDMRTLLPKLKTADIWVLAFPLYMDGMPGPLKTLLDRTLPLAEPFMEIRNGRNLHIVRDPFPDSKIVLVSNCGFWEEENFAPLLTMMRVFCENIGRKFAGALLRPHGPAMKHVTNEAIQAITDSARNAGRELARTGTIPELLLNRIKENLVSRDEYLNLINVGFEQVLRSRIPAVDNG